LECEAPCTAVKPPHLGPLGDGSVGNGLRQGITLCMCEWKKPKGVMLKMMCGNAVLTPDKKEDCTK